MDKFAVVIEEEATKVASLTGRPCPSCGSKSVDYRYQTPHCPTCGTAPWEPRKSNKDFRR